MSKTKSNKKNFKISKVWILVTVIVLLVLGFLWHLEKSKKPAAVTFSTLHTLNEPPGNTINSYSYGGFKFPNLPNKYQFVYKTNKSPTYVIFSNPVEVDYIAKQTTNQTYNDMESVCREHGYKFDNETGVLNYPNFVCSSKIGFWLFKITPASSLIDESWFQQSHGSDPMSTLYRYARVQILSGDVVVN